MRSIVITGANSGIGFQTSKLLIKKGCRVFGSVRRDEEGTRLTKTFGSAFIPIKLDVRDELSVSQAAAQVRRMLHGERLAGLVNNAGIGLPEPLLHQSIEKIRLQIDTNLVGPLVVTKAFLPLLGTDPTLSGPLGRVINMSSIFGKIGAPFGTAYCASKHGLEGFSESLRRELMVYGIPVIIIAPGLTRTQIWTKISTEALARIDSTPLDRAFRRGISLLSKASWRHGLEPQHVASTVWTALTTKRPQLRYAPSHYLEQGLADLIPRYLMDHITDRRLRLSRRTEKNSASTFLSRLERRALERTLVQRGRGKL